MLGEANKQPFEIAGWEKQMFQNATKGGRLLKGKWRQRKKWCDKRGPSSHYAANTSGPFALPRGKWGRGGGGGGGGDERVGQRETVGCELSKWYCQKIRGAIWLWLTLQSRVTHRCFWQLLSLLSVTGPSYRAEPESRSPPHFPEMLRRNTRDFSVHILHVLHYRSGDMNCSFTPPNTSALSSRRYKGALTCTALWTCID